MRYSWEKLDEAKLLKKSVRSLGIKLEHSQVLVRAVKTLNKELQLKKLSFRPTVWLSSEWFSPEGLPGFAIPFYLAHPRLRVLEKKYTSLLEGGSDKELMRLLRHECGHAIDTAYQLRRKRSRQAMFGLSSKTPYKDHYKFRRGDKRFVKNIGEGYAQSHPDEDFAETFACWLQPNKDWQKRFKNWPCLKKLEYMDVLMEELRETPQKIRSREHDTPLRDIGDSLEQYYRKRRSYLESMQDRNRRSDANIGWR